MNKPITPEFSSFATKDRNIVGENVIALSLSGGGLRASAFSLGVLQALREYQIDNGNDIQETLFNDLTFISSVSGGSLTAAYIALNGSSAIYSMRDKVLVKNLEKDLRSSLFSISNLRRLLAGGINDRSNLAHRLHEEVFHGATFKDLYHRGRPDIWINATDLYNRTPFPFSPAAFTSLCSDLSALRLSDAVAASMAVPLVFAPVVLEIFPENCLTPLPQKLEQLAGQSGPVATDPAIAIARAMLNYRNPNRMRYIKLADGGLTDNQGLTSILMARAIGGTPYAPLNEADAIRIRRMLFLIVDAGRPPIGDWALRPDGPSGVDVGVAAAEAAIDSATRLGADAFRKMVQEWRDSIVEHRCAIPSSTIKKYIDNIKEWRCDDVTFMVGTVSSESLDAETASKLRRVPTRLQLPPEQIDLSIKAGKNATLINPELQEYIRIRAKDKTTKYAE